MEIRRRCDLCNEVLQKAAEEVDKVYCVCPKCGRVVTFVVNPKPVLFIELSDFLDRPTRLT